MSGYVTDILTDRAVAFVERERPGPFFLFIGHKAIHPDARQLDDGSVDPNLPSRFVPAPRHLGRYDDAVFRGRPNVISSLDELSDKPALRRALLAKSPDEPQEKSDTAIDALFASIDIAPTILDVAGAPIGDEVQGRSLIPLFRGPVVDWREALLVEFYTYENPFPWLVDMDYRAIRTDRYKYIHWMQHPDENELYDLVEDPYEMDNRIDDPRLAGVRAWLRGELADAPVGAMGLGARR